MMEDYLLNLRKEVGNRPLVVAGVSIIVLKKREILLIKRSDNGLWGLSAGSIELNEDPKNAICRELVEETGLITKKIDLRLLNVFGGKDFLYTYPNGDVCSFVISSFLTECFTGTILKQTDESTDCRFFSLTSLPTNILKHEKLIIYDFKKILLVK